MLTGGMQSKINYVLHPIIYLIIRNGSTWETFIQDLQKLIWK